LGVSCSWAEYTYRQSTDGFRAQQICVTIQRRHLNGGAQVLSMADSSIRYTVALDPYYGAPTIVAFAHSELSHSQRE